MLSGEFMTRCGRNGPEWLRDAGYCTGRCGLSSSFRAGAPAFRPAASAMPRSGEPERVDLRPAYDSEVSSLLPWYIPTPMMTKQSEPNACMALSFVRSVRGSIPETCCRTRKLMIARTPRRTNP